MLTRQADFFRHLGIPGNVYIAPKVLGSLNEIDQSPVVQEGDHGALAAAQVEAVVPVGAQAQADAALADLLSGEIERALEMLVDGRLTAIGEGLQKEYNELAGALKQAIGE